MSAPQTEIILRNGGKDLARVTLPPGEYVIGRNPDAHIYADTPLISRRHALLTIKDDRLLIEDLGSSNGTYVANKRVTKATRLSPKESVRLGDVTLETRSAPAPVPAPTAAVDPVSAASGAPPAAAPGPSPAQALVPVPMAKDPAAKPEEGQKEPAARTKQLGLRQDLTTFVRRYPGPAIGTVAVFILLLVAVAVGVKAFMEARRTRQILAELRGAAPTLEAQSRVLASAGKFPEAMEKIGYAAQLVPDNADYQLAHANLLESNQHFSEAAAAYGRVLALRPGDAAAKSNLELCERLMAEKGASASLPAGAQGLLRDSLHAQHRDREAAALAALPSPEAAGTSGAGAADAEATIRARLKSYTTQKNWKPANVRASGKGFLVDLSGMQLEDLKGLNGLPVVALLLNGTQIADLRPLTGLPLEELALNTTPVADLTPLHGMKLRSLDISDTGVSDLAPLAGMPLEKLDLARTKVKALGPLHGMPLVRLRLNGSSVTDVGPLAELSSLEELQLPAGAANLERLRPLKKLRYLSTHFDDAAKRPAQTVAEFWKEYDAKKAPAQPPKVSPAPVAKAATPPPKPAAPPSKVPAAPAEPPPSPEDVAADTKALDDAKRKRLDFFAKFEFIEARSAILDPALKTSQARDEQQTLAKKAQWLANFKASLIEELTKKGYGQPMSRKSGEGLSGSVMQADDQQITVRSLRGPIVVPWPDLSFDSIFTMGSSFIQTDMPSDWEAYRKWHLGVFAFYAGKRKEALDLLHSAARLKPLYKDELPIFEKPTNPW